MLVQAYGAKKKTLLVELLKPPRHLTGKGWDTLTE
jgi:hypothetical protein